LQTIIFERIYFESPGADSKFNINFVRSACIIAMRGCYLKKCTRP